MRYVVSDAFTKLSQTGGTIQNVHRQNAVEVSDEPVKNGGLLLYPRKTFTFSGVTLYARCAGSGGAEIRVVPFLINFGGTIQTATAEDPLDASVDELLTDALNGNYTSDPDTDSTINDMLNSTTPIDTGDGFSDFVNELFP